MSSTAGTVALSIGTPEVVRRALRRQRRVARPGGSLGIAAATEARIFGTGSAYLAACERSCVSFSGLDLGALRDQPGCCRIVPPSGSGRRHKAFGGAQAAVPASAARSWAAHR